MADELYPIFHKGEPTDHELDEPFQRLDGVRRDAAESADLRADDPATELPRNSSTVRGDSPPPRVVTVTLPVAAGELVAELAKTRYSCKKRHIDLKVDTNTIHRLLVGLDEADARLKNGRRVVNVNDVVRYLLEEVGRQLNGEANRKT